MFRVALAKYGIKQYKVATLYYPRTSGQVGVTNREINMILAKFVKANRSDWSRKLNDDL